MNPNPNANANANATARPDGGAHLPRPRLRRSVCFWCGLMVLLFLVGTWAAGSRESRLFLFQTGGGKSIWAFNIDGWGYGFRLSRAVPLPPSASPAGLLTCDGLVTERKPLPSPLGWDQYEDFGQHVTRASIDHWFLVAAHLAAWGGVMYGRSRRIRWSAARLPAAS